MHEMQKMKDYVNLANDMAGSEQSKELGFSTCPGIHLWSSFMQDIVDIETSQMLKTTAGSFTEQKATKGH